MKCWLYAGFGLGLGACAGPAAHVAAAPTRPQVVSPSAPKPAYAARAAFDANGSAVDVAIWVRLTNPTRDLAVLGQLMGIGSMLDPSRVLKQRLGPALGGAVNQELPVDLTLHTLVDKQVVFAFGVDDIDSFTERTRAAYVVRQIADGRWQLQPKESPDPNWLTCELWQAGPPVNARLLCSDAAQAIASQAPFLMSVSRKIPDGSSLHLEFPGSAFKSIIDEAGNKAKQARSSNGGKDNSAAAKLGEGLIYQLGNELNLLSYDVTLGDSSVEVKQELGFSETHSLVSLLIAGHAAPHAPVPEAFWRLPADSDLALYFEGAEPKPLRAAWAALAAQLSAIPDPEYETLPAYREREHRAIEQLAARGGATLLASGQDREQAQKALETELKPAKSAALRAQLQNIHGKLQNWWLMGLEDDPESYIAGLREQAVLQKTPRQKKHVTSKDSSSAPKPEPADETASYFTEVPLTPASGLPKGSAHFQLETRSNPKYVAQAGASYVPPVPSTWQLLAVPDGKYVWLSLAHEESAARTRIRALLANSTANTLASDADLRRAASGSVSGVGYASIAWFTGFGFKASSSDEVRHSSQLLSRLWSLPAKGATHIPFILQNDGGNGVARRLSLRAQFTPPAISDLLQLVISGGHEHQ